MCENVSMPTRSDAGLRALRNAALSSTESVYLAKIRKYVMQQQDKWLKDAPFLCSVILSASCV